MKDQTKSIKIGKLIPILFFVILAFSTTTVSRKAEEDKFNSTFDLFYEKVQNDMHKNLFRYKSVIKLQQFNNSIRISLEVKILFKWTAYVIYKPAIEHIVIKLGKSL